MHDAQSRAELVDVIRQVRARWRTKLALRGAVVVVAGSLLALFLSARGLEVFRFSSPSIIAFRVVTFTVFAALALYWLLGPLMRRVSDVQVALYLEERDSSLQAAILSAVEAAAAGGDEAARPHSAALVNRLVAQAVERCRDIDFGRTFERPAIRRQLATLAGLVAAATLLLVFGPAYLRHGVSALLVISRNAEAASPYHIDVKPGDTTVPRGSDQAVSARFTGFTAADATLMMRPTSSGAFERVPLVSSGDPARFEGMLFHVEQPVEYYVEAAGVRSPTFTMQVVDLPGVRQLDLEYRFPAYTGLPPQKVDSAGDVAALHGTQVVVHVVPTMKTPGGRIVLNETGGSVLTLLPDGSLTGTFTIEKQGFYRIELTGPKGEPVSASPQYTVDVVDDQAPSVSFTKPGRDSSATPVEELFVEAKADDDFGVKDLRLHYSVNGGPEKTVTLFDGAKPMREVSAGHTIYLEELGLQPGDFVSYYARATDNDSVPGPQTATSDIYFVQIRPFRKDYKPAQSQAQGGGGGQGGVGALSQQQRQIVAATFNVVRDRAKTTAEKFRQDVVFLTLAQSKLRQQVDELVTKMGSRLGDHDSAFKKIAQALPKASAEMKSAEGRLQAQKAKDALTPEQHALKLLQDAEQEYEVQVSAGRSGGGGRNEQMADDLADLFALEMDKLANQYEMQQRADQQSADKQLDELAERLKELARRQQQEAERQRQMAAAGSNAAGGGASQRALAQQAEEAARRLEQLLREQPRADLGAAARRLQDAADAMRRAAANGARDNGAQAAAAEEQLKEAERQLERSRSQGTERDVQNAARKAAELADQEKQVAGGVERMRKTGGEAHDAQARTLGEQKDQMEAGLAGLEQQLQRLADGTRTGQREASRKLEDAADSIRDNKVKEKIRYSKGMLQGGNPEYARAFEENIGSNLDELQKKIGEAAGALGQASKETAMNRALEKARDLVRGMQSLDERMKEQGSRGSRGSQGSQGQTGRLSGDERRQLGRELREQQATAEQLRRQLTDAGVKPGDLDEILREMQRLASDRLFDDPRGLQHLQSAALDRMKTFEFDLRKKTDANGQPLSLPGSDEVPAGFRQAIEEYYRALAKKGSPK